MSTETGKKEEKCAELLTFAHFLEKVEGQKGATVFVLAAALNLSTVEVARLAGVSRRTAVYRLANPVWKEVIRNVRAWIFDSTLARVTAAVEKIALRLSGASDEAVKTLQDVASGSDGDSAKVAAARSILQLQLAFQRHLAGGGEGGAGDSQREADLQEILEIFRELRGKD